MSRVPQKPANRGSQKWIQALVNRAPYVLDRAIAHRLGFLPTDKIVWTSPLAEDEYAEYRDDTFLSRIDARVASPRLHEFWPARGPQWDALGRTSRGEPLLVGRSRTSASSCPGGRARAGTPWPRSTRACGA
jgi:hypothetical protein